MSERHTEGIVERQPAAKEQARTRQLMRRVTIASVIVAVALIVAKIIAWLLSDSVALLSTLADSMLDALASIVTLIAVRHALQPADQEHRFGHGKAEALAALAQAAFIAGASIFLLIEAGKQLVNPAPITAELTGIGVMAFAIILTLGLVAYQSRVVRQTQSLAISADRLHYSGDLLINGSVIVSLGVHWLWGIQWIDPLFAIGIVGFLSYNAYQIGKSALDMLMDRELPDAERAKIRTIVMAHAEVRDMHDLRTRRSGLNSFIQLHLELPADIRLLQAHTIAELVEQDLLAAFPGAEVLIHQDPAGTEAVGTISD